MTRTALWPLALILLVLAGCGGSDEGSDAGSGAGSDAGSGASQTPPPAPESNAFPVTLQHKYGETTIEAAPERIAVVGLREVDDLLALDIVPVLTAQFVGVDTDESGVREWARDELGDREEPEAIDTTTDGIPVERVAASNPDLIVGRFSGMTQGEYDQLSQIAPVLAQPEEYADYGEPWQEEMRAVGEAVGQAEEADRLVAETEQVLADAREANPEFEGRTAITATPFQGFYVYGPEDPRGRLVADLGFDAPDGLQELVGDQFGAQLPDEQVDLLDVDALLWLVETDEQREQIESNPVYRRLGVRERAQFFTPDGVVYDGASATTVLSIPAVLDQLVPQLQEAVAAAG